MAKVRMIVGVSGSRHDGEPWPPAGEILECPEWEAQDLINGGNAVKVGDEDVAHVGETVPASVPPGSKGEGRVTEGKASPEEIMTGHPADEAAAVRAAEDQHGGRAAAEGDQTHRVSGLREHAGDPRPDSQILAEDYDPAEIERIDLGKTTMGRAKDKPAGARRKQREEAVRETARLRAGDRESALRYAAEGGISGAPGAEVPALAEGDDPYVHGPGVRPDSQVEAELGTRGEDGSYLEPEMTDLEKAEFESRGQGYTRPAEVRDSPSPGQPSGRPRARPTAASTVNTGAVGKGEGTTGAATTGEEDAAVTDLASKESATGASAGEVVVAGDGEDKSEHKVTATSESPISVTKDDGSDAPPPSATKQEWVDYAVSKRGADVHEASAMTKADLMSRYGGRL